MGELSFKEKKIKMICSDEVLLTQTKTKEIDNKYYLLK